MVFNFEQHLLIKLGSEENMKNLYEKGELYLQTFEYFKNLEKTNDGRGDPDEYLTEYYAGNGLDDITLELACKNNITGETIKHLLSRATGIVSFSLNESTKMFTHLYCMSLSDIKAIKKHSTLISPDNFAENKDFAVVIFDYNEFLNRIKNQLQENNIPAAVGKIKYVNKENYGGDMGCFCKFDEYAYQNEWRLAVRIPSNKAEKIHIGSLEDIAFEPIHKDIFLKTQILFKNVA